MKGSRRIRISAPPFRRDEILRAADYLTDEYVRKIGRDAVMARGLEFGEVYRTIIRPKFGIQLIEDIDLGFDPKGEKVLGRFDVEMNRAYIDRSLRIGSGDPRRAFTCWHEVGGHGILQGDWLRERLAQMPSGRFLVTTEPYLSLDTQNKLEWQANQFAARASAPTWFVRDLIVKVFKLRRPFWFTRSTKYSFYVNGRDFAQQVRSYDHLCSIIAGHIAKYFWGLSRESLTYRVKETGWVVDRSRGGLSLQRLAG